MNHCWVHCRQNMSLQLQHHREDDAVEHDIVFTNEMDQFGVWAVPVWASTFAVINGPLFAALIYPIGASNHTYSTFPSLPGIFSGKLTPPV